MPTAGDRELIAALVRGRLGLLIPYLYDDRVEAAFGRVQETLGTPSVSATIARLETFPYDSEPWQVLIEGITVGETCFLRHRSWFAELETRALAPVIAARRAAGDRRLALWSAGCATGEEPYTLAMLVRRLIPDLGAWNVRIFGTDMNLVALERARQATYGEWSLRELDAGERAASFRRERGGRWRLRPEIRSMVTLAPLNLSKDWLANPDFAPESFDLVICRNVLMYMPDDVQAAVAARLARAIAPGGWLAVSPAEAVAGWYRPLTVVQAAGSILFCRPASGTEDSATTAAAPLPPRPVPARRRPPVALVRPPPPAPLPPSPVAAIRAVADSGRLGEARRRCEEAIAAECLDRDLHLLLATICLETGDEQAALAAARSAAYVDPDSAAAHFLTGAILLRTGAAEAGARAMTLVLRLLQADPPETPIAGEFDTTVGSLRQAALAALRGEGAGERRGHGLLG